LAAFGRPHTPPTSDITLQQRQIELALELANGFRYRGLTDEQRLGGTGEAAVLGDGEEDAQQMKVHSRDP
jgi:hypothetical protein